MEELIATQRASKSELFTRSSSIILVKIWSERKSMIVYEAKITSIWNLEQAKDIKKEMTASKNHKNVLMTLYLIFLFLLGMEPPER